ncbi:unnamed protein product [Rhizoctonia solani]|uniref:Mid2 domain-containing protein n=1 Tax=Rhizoctonia solani TaxID=456999 RepID=A0A8H3D9E1_9AGAM|nr:unnamed protein product [Rhizoctonia solani]
MLWFLHLLNVAAYASLATSAVLNSRQIQWPPLPNNLTVDVLQVAFAISPPCAANSSWCQQLTQVVFCRYLGANVCAGILAVGVEITIQSTYYCAICMSNPADNQTTPDQTQAASAGHAAFHVACNAYEELINGTASTTSSTSSTSMLPTSSQTPTATALGSAPGDNKVPIGPVVGGVVGGVVGLALIVGIIYLLAIVLKKSDHRSDVRPSNISYLSVAGILPRSVPRPYLTTCVGLTDNSTYIPGPEPMNPMTAAPQAQPPIQPNQN